MTWRAAKSRFTGSVERLIDRFWLAGLAWRWTWERRFHMHQSMEVRVS
jgi:hypothetical protein